MTPRKHVLVVSHFFPPMGGGGVQRITKCVKYLEPAGWRATVLCGRPEDYWMRDDSLLRDLPPSARVVPVAGASGLGILRRLRPRSTQSSVRSGTGFGLLRRLSSWCLLPDSYIGWRRFALRAADRILADDPPQALLSTGPPETNHLVALALRARTGLPWVADFRDPWFALHLYPAPTAWHRARHARLERAVLTQADAVLATTDWLGALLRQRSGVPQKVHVVRNGFDPEDFPAPGPDANASGRTGPLHLVHTGMLTLTRSADGLLLGLHRLLQDHPEYRDAFRITLIGARESGNDARIGALGLQDCVVVQDYVPHQEAIVAMQRADVLVLIKHTEERFRGLIPGKLYEYMGARRPILALVPESEAADLVRRSGSGEVVPGEDAAAVARALETLLHHKRNGTLAAAYTCSETQPYDRREQAIVVAHLLDGLIPGGGEAR